MNTPQNTYVFFETPREFETWLANNFATEKEVWLQIYKKNSGKISINHAAALDVALCYGWIDGIAKSLTDESYMQRFTPRRSTSKWSKVNTEHVTRLLAEGRMQPSGIAAVEAAKADGRWEDAYDSPKNAVLPPEFLARLEANKKAKRFFDTLTRVNIYAMTYRLQNAKKAETKERLMIRFIEMLEKGESFH